MFWRRGKGGRSVEIQERRGLQKFSLRFGGRKTDRGA